MEPRFGWKLFLSHEEIARCSLLGSFRPTLKTVAEILSLLSMLDEVKICDGNPDNKFCVLSAEHKGVFMDPTGITAISCERFLITVYMYSYLTGSQVSAREEQNTLPYPTTRHRGCEILLPADASVSRCKSCIKYRNSLRSQLSRRGSTTETSDSRTDPTSHVSTRYLRTPEKDMQMKKLHETTRALSKKVSRLEAKTQAAAEKAGVIVDDGMHQDIKAIMCAENAMVKSRHPPGSFQHQFWEQQLKAASCKNARGMRWHPLMIRWCLYFRHRSSGAYETLRDSGVLRLSSQRTLRDYTYYVKAHVGFSHEVDKQLMDAACVQTCKEWQKCVAIIFDEMHIPKDLVYDKHTGEIIGFTNLGEINLYLQEFERSLEATPSGTEPLASTMNVFMVRGLFTRLQFPYVQFPCSNVSGDLLFNPFWKAVERVERCRLKVVAATADGSSVNRKLFKLHGDGKHMVHKVVNPFAADNREIFFFSDPPHLLKTTRNCMVSTARNL